MKMKNISQEELAYDADMPLSQIGRIERGTLNTSISIIYDIAQALKLQPKDLFDFQIENKKVKK